ncbi:hypothetical protein NA57DRAFT_78975 [Rhizodiscina lignyota]|uniref:Ankyrin n=1 Tax=Rhizodiscina lignyota TaxID=1504668 RepID=A0A9P4M6D5_9PEZI|nr:hypothetical protein NA57DRAFT_78975 [Rhizodiscina lignyota]
MTIPIELAVSLTEDEIDDILYLSRAGEAAELQEFLNDLSKKYNVSQADVICNAADAESGNNAVHYTSANGHIDILNLFKSYFSSDKAALTALINAPNQAGNTSLHWAALNGQLQVVQLLVVEGADPAKTNNAGHDVVFEAERNDKEETVKWLLKEVPGLERAVGGSGNGVETEVDGEDMDVDGGTTVSEGSMASRATVNGGGSSHGTMPG